MAQVLNDNILALLKGEKGEKGDGLDIKKWYSSTEEMNADYDNPDIAVGDSVAIKGTLDLYDKGETAFEHLGKLVKLPNIEVEATIDGGNGTPSVDVEKSGTDENPTFTLKLHNLKGDAAATIEVESTITGEAGTNASVTNSGTDSAVKLNFTIPRGERGEKGEGGEGIVYEDTLPTATETSPALVVVTGETNG